MTDSEMVKYMLSQAKKGQQIGFYDKLWKAFTAADHNNKKRLVRAYPELLEMAKEYLPSEMRTQAMAEAAEREFV